MRPIFSHDLGDFLLVIECDDELVEVRGAGPRQTSIRHVIVNKGKPEFFVVLIHQHAKLEPIRGRWSVLKGQGDHVPPGASSVPYSHELFEWPKVFRWRGLSIGYSLWRGDNYISKLAQPAILFAVVRFFDVSFRFD